MGIGRQRTGVVQGQGPGHGRPGQRAALRSDAASSARQSVGCEWFYRFGPAGARQVPDFVKVRGAPNCKGQRLLLEFTGQALVRTGHSLLGFMSAF